MRESKIEEVLRLGVEYKGGECFKWVSPNRSGVPDRIVVLPGVIVFVETKAPNGELKSWQARCHARLTKLGFRVEVLWTVSMVHGFLCSL
jgi:G:T-mismatch repair DNA endonuclease (very short patch repair protein)